MRAPGEILLVSCYELGHQPLSLASPLALLARAGYAPEAVDTSVEPLDDNTIARARLVAIAVPMHTALRLGTQVAERVRARNAAAYIVFYGLYAALNADYLLRRHADAVIAGEYETPLLRLVEALAADRHDVIVGVGTHDHRAVPALERVPFAVPARAQLPQASHYARLRVGDRLALTGYVEATRGCLHTCAHCPITPIYHGRFFAVPREIVLADIRQQVAVGVEHITFGDPDFLNGPTHALRIVRALHSEFPWVTFDATIKIEHILEHRRFLTEMRALGCAFVLSAVESLSATVLARLRKGHTPADVAEALAILDAAGIPLRISLVAFTPWTTPGDYLEVLDFIAAHGLIEQVDPVQYTIRLLVPPGSAMLDEPDTREWLGALDEAAFTYRWAHPDPAMDQLYHGIQALVEAHTRAGEMPVATFAAVYAQAAQVAGRDPLSVASAGQHASRGSLPHLTESWFC
ncbi:MAG TPA: CUAEP/CCAEP-tail radical SAM protein [Ktedonobacterales bacterium]|nr:CUAEP/CCAEP-tail radical SAM protein [Ktedonobacterales bacterium]